MGPTKPWARLRSVSYRSSFVDLCPNCESTKDHEQNYIHIHDALPMLSRPFRDVAHPNHFLIGALSFAVFAGKSPLQAFRQKRKPQWLWQTRPNFPPQCAQRFSNLVMKLSTNLEVDCTTRQTRASVRIRLTRRVQSLPEAHSDYVCDCRP